MLKLLIRYIKFAGTSVVGTIVDTLVLWLLSGYVLKDSYWGQYIISPVLSFQCAVVVNFTIFYFYVWRDRTREDLRRRKFLKLFLSYDLSCSSVFAVRLLLLLTMEKFFGWGVVVCNLVAMCFSGIVNFILNNRVIFMKNKNDGTNAERDRFNFE